ncbi:hypothetical protein C8R42DRAFT_585677, partial [Lentinula raphanica]
MDLKASRPFFGLADVKHRLWCIYCGVWHPVSQLRTDIDRFGLPDDDRLREGAEKWRSAQSTQERDSIYDLYGTRSSAFTKLSYWRSSRQVVVDPMHTMFQLLQQNFFRSPKALGLQLINEDDDEITEESHVAFHHELHRALREIIVPAWVRKPPMESGLARVGTLKADHWRTMFNLYLPLAQLSLWQPGSPIAGVDALQMGPALHTSMKLTCASLMMTKRTLTGEHQEQYRLLLQQHILGLKQYFPAFSLPSHHLAFHIYDFMDLFSVVSNWWCFHGENLVQKLRLIPHNHK